MPWTCATCAAEVRDDALGDCPECGQRKTAWTVVQDKTRTMVIATRKRFETLRGEWDAPLEAIERAYDGAAWLPTDVIPAVHVDVARQLMREGKLPAPRDLLVVREHPGGAADLGINVTIDYEQRRAQDRALPGPTDAPREDGSVDARVLALWGATAPVEDVAFDGVSVLDVSEETPRGHAPTIRVAALKKPAKRLQVVAGAGVYRGVMKGLFFETDLAFLLPVGVPAMKRLRGYHEEHPGAQVLVVGHTDTTGAREHNLVLSVERAEAVAAYLRDDVDHWLAYFGGSKGVSKPWGTREVQWMLSALPDDGERFYAGPPSGVNDPATSEAVKRFQAWSNETRGTALDVDGAAGPLTRRELVAAYMQIDGTTLPEGTTLLTHGCGEHHPAVDAGDEANVQENRRVELFLFGAPGVRPAPTPCTDPGCLEHPAWLEAVIETIDLTLDPPKCPPLVATRLPSLFSRGRTFPKPTALPLLKELAARLAADPSLSALVVGHTDTTGNDFTNLELSLGRARAVAALLTGDVAYLRDRFRVPDPLERWSWEEIQWMLSAVEYLPGRRAYVAGVDGAPGRLTFRAVKVFQMFNGLDADGAMDDATLDALMAAYIDLVGPVRPARGRVTVQGGGEWHAPRGFGEHGRPLAGTGYEDSSQPGYRRVEVFLGAFGEQRPLARCRASRHTTCAAYEEVCAAVAEEIARDPLHTVRVRLIRPDWSYVAGLEVVVRDDAGNAVRATTDGVGVATLKLEPGFYVLEVNDAGEVVHQGVFLHAEEVGGVTFDLPEQR